MSYGIVFIQMWAILLLLSIWFSQRCRYFSVWCVHDEENWTRSRHVDHLPRKSGVSYSILKSKMNRTHHTMQPKIDTQVNHAYLKCLFCCLIAKQLHHTLPISAPNSNSKQIDIDTYTQKKRQKCWCWRRKGFVRVEASQRKISIKCFSKWHKTTKIRHLPTI